ncbi:MAG: hypothetical protein FJX76_18310 [Armatimonadetes bacterium]|nr:hypothetical protein [Armatimonadota bacterium]
MTAPCRASGSTDYTQIHTVKDIPLKHPAYSQIGPAADGTPAQDLWVTTFAPFGKDLVTRIPLARAIDPRDESVPEVFTDQVAWPNDLTFHDGDVYFGSGFLMPGKSTGTISKAPIDGSSPPAPVTADKKRWFYHKPWVLANGDILTARATKPIVWGDPQGELVLLHPGATGQATEQVLAAGPDMHLLVADVNRDGKPEAIAPEYFGEKLSLFTEQNGVWKQTVIDADLGPGFDASLEHLEGANAGPALLVTNSKDDGSGGVYAYEIPDQITTQPWIRHTLVEGIPNGKWGPGTGAPGAARAYHLGPHNEGDRPAVLVSTDDGETLMWGIPTGQDWNYKFFRTENLDSTVGKPSVTPFCDAEGFPYIFVPLYDRDLIRVYSFNPKYKPVTPP